MRLFKIRRARKSRVSQELYKIGGGPRMGNLLRETPYSEISAALETLDRLGVTRNDLASLRANNGNNTLTTELKRVFDENRIQIMQFLSNPSVCICPIYRDKGRSFQHDLGYPLSSRKEFFNKKKKIVCPQCGSGAEVHGPWCSKSKTKNCTCFPDLSVRL